MCRTLAYLVSFVLVVGLGTANADIQTGLVGYWPLNEGTGTKATDMSGNSHDGTLYNGATWISPGFIGSAAVNIDGNPGSRIAVGTWDPGERFTLAVWARWTGEQKKAERAGLIGKRNDWSAEGMRWFSEVTISGQVRMRNFTQTVSSPAGALNALIGEWAHVAITFDGAAARIYLNSVEVGSGAFSLGPLDTAGMGFGCKAGGSNSNAEIFSGGLDDARIYNRALSVADVRELFEWTGLPGKAHNPKPADGQTDVARDVVLSWTPGEFAPSTNGHRVYFSENFNDVSNGLGAVTQDANTYTPPQRLDFDKTYYWRIDEVNGPPDNTIHKGNVWSFKAELSTYAVKNITATASSSDANKGPQNTVNGSGLDSTGLLHGNIGEGTMWLSSATDAGPVWIRYEFDKVYKLHEMWVWNSNESLEQVIGLGIKEAVVEYSINGTDFTALGTTHQFNQGSGAAGYAHNTTIDFGGVPARYVRLTAKSNWKGILPQYGLSEVRFFYIPVNARDPQPASGATDLGLDVILGWTAGREAGKHEVYFSSDILAVRDGTTPAATVTQNRYGPVALDLGTTYYWRIDEVNDIQTLAKWSGDLWSFRTQGFFVVDNFESYDAADNQIWYTWKDGLGYGSPTAPPYYPGNGTGSAVGNENTASFTEEAIVHGGKQSMPISYNNNKQGALKYSEATMTLSGQRDWRARGVKELSLWFRGYPGSVGSFVEAPAGTYTLTAGGADIWGTADQFHFAYKQLSGVGSIVAKVLSVQNTNAWAKSGVMIRETLDAGSKFAAVYITPTNADGTPTNGCRFQGRTDTNGSATSDTAVATAEQMAIKAPYWVKLERDAGGNFRGYYAGDGVNWKPMVWRPSISMGSNVYIGLVLTSHDVAVTGQAKFSNVTTTGTVTGQWQSQDVGILSNSAEPLYVAVANKTGASAVVAYEAPAATQIDTWTEWSIKVQAFADQGVNLADVDSLSIGAGSRTNPQAGGTGILYIDDIRLYHSRTAP